MPKTGERILVIQPTVGHEAFLLGGVISRLVAEGHRVTVVTVCQSLDVKARQSDRNQLYQSLIALKITDHRFLGTQLRQRAARTPNLYFSPDDTAPVPVTDNLVPVLFSVDNIQDIFEDLEDLIEETKATALITASTSHDDPVSITLHSLVEVLAEAYSIPAYGVSRNTTLPSNEVLHCDIAAWLEQKRKAIASYPQIARPIGREQYQLIASGTVQDIESEERLVNIYHPRTDVKRGSVVAHSLGSMAFMALAATAGSLVHQGSMELAGIDWPTGLFFGFAMLLAGMIGIRLVNPYSRIPVIAAGISVAVMLAVLSLFGFFGIIIIPDNTFGLVWIVGAVFLTAVITFWPRLGIQKRF